MKSILTLVLIAFLLTACNFPAVTTPASQPIQATGQTTPGGPAPSPTPEVVRVISVALRIRDSAQSAPQVEAGSHVVLQAVFDPQVQTLRRRPDGSVLSSSTTPWEDAPVARMRVCIAQDDQSCDPGDWRPYEAQVSQDVEVDWLGPRPFLLQVEFSDAQGQVIPSVGVYQYDSGSQTELSLTVIGVINPATPLANLPPPVQTGVAATRTAYPVTGSVMIADGRCCAGGPAGSQIRLQVAFQASSEAGKVTEMKVQTGSLCVKDPAQLKGAWQPFQTAQTFETTLAFNWVGWWVSVQYRDSAGNLSPVYCDDISLEGMAPTPP